MNPILAYPQPAKLRDDFVADRKEHPDDPRSGIVSKTTYRDLKIVIKRNHVLGGYLVYVELPPSHPRHGHPRHLLEDDEDPCNEYPVYGHLEVLDHNLLVDGAKGRYVGYDYLHDTDYKIPLVGQRDDPRLKTWTYDEVIADAYKTVDSICDGIEKYRAKMTSVHKPVIVI